MRTLTRHICMGLGVFMLFSCTRQATPDKPGTEPQKGTTAQITLSASSFMLYSEDSSIVRECSVTITSTSKINEVTVDSPSEVTAHLSLSKDNTSGILTAYATGAFPKDSYISLEAINEAGVSSARIKLENAFLSIDRDSVLVSSAGADITLGIETNLSVSISADDQWVQYSRTGNSVEVRIVKNESFEARTSRLVVHEPEGILDREFQIYQEAAIDYLKLEKEALTAIYNSTGGSSWKKVTSSVAGRDVRTEYWCSDKPINQWYGVEVDGSGHVMYLKLDSMNMSGTLPEKIGDLVFCQELILSNNNLSGTLPSRIGEMQALKSIQVSNNSLSGELSSSSLSKLASKMKLISLSGNSFTGSFPQWIGDMPATANFWLQDNCLEGKVPQKVVEHPRWTSPCMDGSGRTIGQVNMAQKEGFVLTE